MSKRVTILVVSVLMAYFVFTSGIVYEAIGSEETNKFIVPYSIALSGERTGLAGIFNKDDQKCAEWIARQSKVVVCDTNAQLLLRSYDFEYANTRALIYFEGIFSNEPHYLFLTTWNTKIGKIVSTSPAAGLRGVELLPVLDATYKEVYRSGKAVVYEN